jgi:integrase
MRLRTFRGQTSCDASIVHDSGLDAAHMRKRNRLPPCRRIVLKLPDLDRAKSAVLNSLSSPHSRRNYKFGMEQFISWYCPEPRLALHRTVVLRFLLHLESLGLAAGTVNQRLAAVRRLAYEAADSGLLSPELAAGIRRVKGAKQLGARMGNCLNKDQARLLLEKADGDDLRSARDLAMLSVLVGCGLRRAELSALTVEDPPCLDWCVTGGIRLPFLPTRWSATHTPNPSNSRRVRAAAYSSRIAVTGFRRIARCAGR